MYYKSILTNMLFFLFTGKERRGKEKSRLSECSMLELFYGFKAEVIILNWPFYKIESHMHRFWQVCKNQFPRVVKFWTCYRHTTLQGGWLPLLHQQPWTLPLSTKQVQPYSLTQDNENENRDQTPGVGGGALRYPQNLDYTFKIYIIVYNTVLLYLYVHFG